ncbi:hypothetical protein DUNSADRAFT_6848 [Dunaliella salina]|uniref:Encoded protein n=1 Tax=Dunaliella salina TaxID=3046 RepID=A0ABQ7GMH9_DUNSA|nr:hypothetical protein DUNSADRAFT_6848 [Dunaliella salina]|eukprot:KAF5835814.1 hypothetical protein DUNSADRAFT_6848 [Dunaliella salina]
MTAHQVSCKHPCRWCTSTRCRELRFTLQGTMHALCTRQGTGQVCCQQPVNRPIMYLVWHCLCGQAHLKIIGFFRELPCSPC